MALMQRWVLGKKSGFDTDSDGNITATVLDSSLTYTFVVNPATMEITYNNFGNEVRLVNGHFRYNKMSNSTVKKSFTISQRLMTETERDSIEAFLDADEDLVVIDDDSNIYIVKITGFSISRRKTTADKPVSWHYEMSLQEL